MPSLASMRQCARDPARSSAARRLSKSIEGVISLMMAAGPDSKPSAPHFVRAHLFFRRTMTKKIIISLAVIVALAMGILYGKGLLSVHQGLEPPPSLAVLVLEKAPKPAPDGDVSPTARAAAMRWTHSRAAMCCSTSGPPGARPASASCPPWPGSRPMRRGCACVAINADSTKVDAAAFLKSHGAGTPAGLCRFRADADAQIRGAGPADHGADRSATARWWRAPKGPPNGRSPEAVAYFKRITGS